MMLAAVPDPTTPSERIATDPHALASLADLASVTGWRLAANVYAWTYEGKGGPRTAVKVQQLTLREFEELGIRGLKNFRTIAKYRNAWKLAITHLGASEPTPGELVDLPEVDYGEFIAEHTEPKGKPAPEPAPIPDPAPEPEPTPAPELPPLRPVPNPAPSPEPSPEDPDDKEVDTPRKGWYSEPEDENQARLKLSQIYQDCGKQLDRYLDQVKGIVQDFPGLADEARNILDDMIENINITRKGTFE